MSQAPTEPIWTQGLFVGRNREFDILTAIFEEANSGHGSVVMLTGEPGIGKTRIIQELANLGAKRDTKVLWSRCYESSRRTPYWPWMQLIRSY
ncbi:MAG: AAA family ATPase, partial [SAR202 cluster bacterium]|nr:AAA family ATPase [SAR202 cluster bacterium]